jgi:hypothetical protein
LVIKIDYSRYQGRWDGFRPSNILHKYRSFDRVIPKIVNFSDIEFHVPIKVQGKWAAEISLKV